MMKYFIYTFLASVLISCVNTKGKLNCSSTGNYIILDTPVQEDNSKLIIRASNLDTEDVYIVSNKCVTGYDSFKFYFIGNDQKIYNIQRVINFSRNIFRLDLIKPSEDYIFTVDLDETDFGYPFLKSLKNILHKNETGYYFKVKVKYDPPRDKEFNGNLKLFKSISSEIVHCYYKKEVNWEQISKQLKATEAVKDEDLILEPK